MKICHIAGAGDFFPGNIHTVSEGDLIIAADGGYTELLKAGIKAHYLVGDFDSLEKMPPEADISGQGPQIFRLPKEKDETDMKSAILLGYDKGFRLFHIHGGTGGRPDHTFANIQILVWLSKNAAGGLLFFENYVMTAITSSGVEIKGSAGDYISLFAYGQMAEGITTQGLKYGLKNAPLHGDDPMGTSNELAAPAARVDLRAGTLIITCPVKAGINFPFLLLR